MYNRKIKSAIKDLKTQYPVLTLSGPRQSGKTTFIKQEFPKHMYLSLENPDVHAQAQEDPRSFLMQNDGFLILDEVQKIPMLINYIQGIVDENMVMAQYILTGSHNMLLMESITQSLAGRVGLLTLLPLDFSEMHSEGLLTSDNYLDNIVRGYYPAIFHRNINSSVFYSNYIKTHINKDVSQLVNIQNANQFKNFLSVIASRAGQQLNYADISKICGISSPTVTRWLSTLETMYIVFELQPYFKNYDKRITKSSKLFFYDTGLLCHLLGIKTGADLKTNSKFGNVFENAVIAEIVKQNEHRNLMQEHYYFRESNNNEVDLLIPDGDKMHIYEIKGSSTYHSRFLDGLKYFENISGENIKSKNVIYTGDEVKNMNGYRLMNFFKTELIRN